MSFQGQAGPSGHHHQPGWEPQASGWQQAPATQLLTIKPLEAIAMPAAKLLIMVWTLPCSRLWAKPGVPARPERTGDQGAGRELRGRPRAIPLGREPLQPIPGFAMGATEAIEVAQEMEVSAAKPRHWSLMPRTHILGEGE